ncbi:non-specific lipid transfer protein GPI-anchored 11-like [Salvia divinorum]|uniref:Non-specific lipid transfer protein GPI-anchored 11-like n=1 Tax=Salvia divinorum TaxID=28513 RepID=A0ABD1HFA4_SALDI
MSSSTTTTTTTIACSVMIAVIMMATATAQSPVPAPTSPEAPAPSLDCFTYLLNLSDCLTFVEKGSNLTQPADGCCPELGNLVDTQPICLCQLLGDPSQVGISVDLNRALKLPSLCNVTTPPVSLCAAIGIPVSALTPTEAPSPALTPTEAPSSGGEETTSPSSDATNVVVVTNHHFLVGLVFFIYFF